MAGLEQQLLLLLLLFLFLLLFLLRCNFSFRFASQAYSEADVMRSCGDLFRIFDQYPAGAHIVVTLWFWFASCLAEQFNLLS